MGRRAFEGVKPSWPAVLERLARTLEKLLEQVKSQAVLVHEVEFGK